MNLSSINNYFNNRAASVLSTGLPSAKNAGAASESGPSSPFAQLLSTLQQLDQSNPAQYQQVTKQIAANLQTAATTAAKNGNSAEATGLTTLSKDFSSASQSGQLPNVKDLASAIGAGHPRLQAHAAASEAAGSVSSSALSPSTNTTLQQLLASLHSGTTPSKSTNPMSIIMSTLSSAGISS